MTDLHSDWAPSAMGRILSCPASVEVVKLYEKADSDASNLGTVAHGVLEDALIFDIPPEHPDIGIVEGVQLAVDWVEQELLKAPAKLHIEQRLEIPGTPVWGTTDLLFVNDSLIHVADYKHGYLPVAVERNRQMMTYLEAAIHKFGERDEYKISVIQPRYDHIDGPIRTYSVTQADLEEYRVQLAWALSNTHVFSAGKHCKYCPARGGCKAFNAYLAPHLSKALYWELTEVHLVSDDTLAELLEFADLVPGWITELRKEAMRRTFQGRTVPGHKVVNGRETRDWAKEAETGLPEVYERLGIPPEALYEAKLVSPATAEKHVKATFKGLGRNKWREPWKEVEKLITTKRGAPALVREIDGRPRFKKGMEFSELVMDEEGDILI